MTTIAPATKNVIITGIKEAGNTILKYKGQSNIATKEKDFDYGIPADIISEKIILKAIKKTGIDCEIISEESGTLGNEKSKLKIYIDSLDGTVNFSRSIPSFCIGLAIYENKIPLLGIIYDPSNNELFIAEKNKGVTLNGKKIKPKYNSKKILVNLEWFGAPEYDKVVKKLRKHKIRARTAGSGVLALCYSMIGRGDAAILINNSPWDVAPGMVFAKEFGCIIKQLDGKEVDLNNKKIDLLAAPRPLFKKLFKIING